MIRGEARRLTGAMSEMEDIAPIDRTLKGRG